MPIISLTLKARFYAKLVIKYLMTSFYATVIGIKCIVKVPLQGSILYREDFMPSSLKQRIHMTNHMMPA